MDTLYKNVPVDNVKEVFIIGSITGYKYNESSDIDVNVKVKEKPEIYHDAKDTFSGEILEGTRRPINYFITEEAFEEPSDPEDWADYKFGVYDVLSNNWLKKPPAREGVRDPKQQFRDDLIAAQLIANRFTNESEELRKDILDYNNLQKLAPKSELLKIRIARKIREIEDDLKDLIEYAQDAKAGRKLVYNLGYGVPRESFNNIVYKMIEHGQHGKLFEKLKTIKDHESKKALLQTFLRQSKK